MVKEVTPNEIFGLIRPEVDVHTLGVSVVGKLIEDCGYKVYYGNYDIAHSLAKISEIDNISLLISWIRTNRITRLGFSYRLDPKDAQRGFGRVFHLLKENGMFIENGGTIHQIYFAGLPEACSIVQLEYNNQVPVFIGDETPIETLTKLGVPLNKAPESISKGSKYDDDRLSFAQKLIKKGDYQFELPPNRTTYPNFGTFQESIIARIKHNRSQGNIPLMRAHVGPYNPNYKEALKEFKSWLKTLGETKYLDIVSIGSSQLSQSDFGKEWGDKPNGGGVPINSEQDLHEIWNVSRPMLIRTYAGTSNIHYLADVYEKTINIAWHALSFWWFNQIDGRGPYTVKQNLQQHFDTLKVIAKTSKPFEPNIPHHFSFRGADDYSYVLSAYLAAITAKRQGIRYLILQTMLNTPKYTWGIQDLAKARALLLLVRELEDNSFTVFLQPRAGLDYFSPDFDKAKVQLASVTAMMDDIEPDNPNSPDIIHVVSYCEASALASPEYINESIQITINALNEYRKQKKSGLMNDMKSHSEVIYRTNDLYHEVKNITKLIDQNIAQPYTPEGLYTIFKKGIMLVPYLWEGREEFKDAVQWNTNLVDGGVKVIDSFGTPINPSDRVRQIFLNL